MRMNQCIKGTRVILARPVITEFAGNAGYIVGPSAQSDTMVRVQLDEGRTYEAWPASLDLPAPRAVDAVTHTPGPWHVDMRTASGGDAFIWGPDGSQRGYIARVNLCAVERTDQTAREANARLMAAAPDLLAALQLARARLTRDAWNNKDAIDAADAAIARARGEA